MAAHPNYVTVRGVIIPCAPLKPDMELEPRPESEGQPEPSPEKPTYRVEIDYAGNWIIKGVTVMMPQAAPRTEPPSAWPQDPQPEEQTYEEPAPEPEIEPEPPPPRPAYLRCVPPPGPRRARGGPPPLGPNPAARGMDPLAPEFTPNLVRKTARIMAGMDRVIRPGGIATDEGLSAAVHAGMRHLAAHKGDVRAAIASAKAAGAGHGSKPAADHAHVAVAASASRSGAKLLSEVAAGLESAAGVAETAGIGLAAAIVLAPTPAGPGEEAALRAYRAGHAGTAEANGFEPPPPSPPLPGLVPPPSPQRRPDEGGFTPAPPMPPLPGFTPSPPSVPVHPGRPADANKPIIVEAKKPAEGATGHAAKAGAITSGSGRLSGAVNQLNPVERAMADRLVAQGHNVEAVRTGEKPTPDFIVDGQETELKTLNGTGPNTLKNAIQKAASQSKSQILIDARNIPITEESALAQIRRAEGNVGSLKGRITILTQDGIISY